MTMLLNEIMDHLYAKISIIPPANATPVVINTVAPPLTLHTDAGWCLFSAEVPGPRTHSPLQPLILECELAHHPDKAFVQQLISNLVNGCAIGYNGPQFAANAKHLSSALQHPTIIDESLKKEIEAGCILGPFDDPPLPNLRYSGLGAMHI